MNRKPIVSVSEQNGLYTVRVNNNELSLVCGVDRNTVLHDVCQAFVNQHELIQELQERNAQQAELILNFTAELAGERKKLKQFKRTFVEARALHDLRVHVNKLLESKARIGMLPAITTITFDEEMRRFIKQYQDRVESWPVDTTTGELLPHVARVTNNTEVRATPLTSNDTAPRMPRAHLLPVTDVQAMNIGGLPSPCKPRVRVLPAHQRFRVTKGAGAISARGGIVYAVNKTSPKLWWVHWANYNPSWENCESLYISDPSFSQVRSRDNEH